MNSSNSEYHAGFVESVVNEFKRQKTYCSKDTVRLGGESLYTTIRTFENMWDFLELSKNDYLAKRISKQSFLRRLKIHIHSNIILMENHLPTLTPDELYTVIMKSKDRKTFFRNLIFSQCKSKVNPRLAKGLKVKALYDFDNSRDDRIKIIDQQLARKSVLTVQFNAGQLLIGNGAVCAPHVTLLNGRQWNEKRKRCEYRMVNSWGNSCEDLNNPNLTCRNGEIWVGETYLDRYLNSVTWSEQSPMLRAQEDPNYEDYDPDF